ncbi:MAG: Gfo/Idh/MocA family oxidoreductase [Lachnospiraceae bacterium]|nr:Gfo/Idh/MocA family oxidoreductase [Lachnospiraceae bacterium]
MNELQFGIIGAGKIAGHFCRALDSVQGAFLAAVASKSPDRAKAFAEKHQVPAWYGSYAEMLARDDISVVYIATTNNFHYENIMQCLRAGKHVICEKAMVASEEEAACAFRFAKEKGLFLMEGMWVRYVPKIDKVMEWLHGGRIGELKLAQATLGFPAEKNYSGRMYCKELGGGALQDVGVYPIEILSYLIGEPVQEVQSFVTFAETGVDETVSLNLRYPTCQAGIQCSIATKLPEDGFLYGTRGYIRLVRMHSGNTVELYDNTRTLVESYTQGEENMFIYQIQDAVNCIRAGKLEATRASSRMTLECARIFDQCLKGILFRPMDEEVRYK